MSSITYIGLDVHTTNYTICSYNGYDGKYFGEVTVKPEYQQIEKYVNRLKKQYEPGHRFLCGYEAGYIGTVPQSADPERAAGDRLNGYAAWFAEKSASHFRADMV